MSSSKIKLIYAPDENCPMIIAVFLSGSGTNFVALYEEQMRLQETGERLYGKIDAVFTNVSNSKGAEKAKKLGIPVVRLISKAYFEAIGKDPNDEKVRNYYDAASIALVEQVCSPDLIVLAGYRRRLGSLFLSRYNNRVINLYPGDVTKDYLIKGVDASVQALQVGEDSIKCTVYIQKDKERFGPAIAQSAPISLMGFNESDKELMNAKIRKKGEWEVLPFTVHHLLARGRVGIDSKGNIYVDGEKMGYRGYQQSSI